MRKPPIQTSNEKAFGRQTDNGKCMIVDVQTHIHPPNWMKEMVEKGFLDIRSGKAMATRWHGVSFSAVEDFTNLEKQMQVLSSILCKILFSQFLKEREILPHFPNRI